MMYQFSKTSCVAICTLNSDLDIPLDKVAAVGKCFTENLGVEKVVKKIISNNKIRFLILCGEDVEKRKPGEAIKCLAENGVEENGKIIGAKSLMPFIKNLTASEIYYFRNQITVVDLIGEKDVSSIIRKVSELDNKNPGQYDGPMYTSKEIPVIEAGWDYRKEWTVDEKYDENWFVINVSDGKIIADHYTGYGEETQQCCKIIGNKAEEIAAEIVKRGKVTKMYHAAYLGKELQKAETALNQGKKYVQEDSYEDFQNI
ncbi:MAG: DUF4346 domain-containing protein [Candidatus Aenigmarchaeota archaeon]|nr:DUF4346 domain-containing protein [Candidatus Aenigmarchaeota archaeon]